MREKYESLSLTILKDIAKNRGMKGVSALKKNELIERMLELDEKTRQERIENAKKLEKEKSRLEKTIHQLSQRLEFVEETLASL